MNAVVVVVVVVEVVVVLVVVVVVVLVVEVVVVLVVVVVVGLGAVGLVTRTAAKTIIAMTTMIMPAVAPLLIPDLFLRVRTPYQDSTWFLNLVLAHYINLFNYTLDICKCHLVRWGFQGFSASLRSQ